MRDLPSTAVSGMSRPNPCPVPNNTRPTAVNAAETQSSRSSRPVGKRQATAPRSAKEARKKAVNPSCVWAALTPNSTRETNAPNDVTPANGTESRRGAGRLPDAER